MVVNPFTGQVLNANPEGINQYSKMSGIRPYKLTGRGGEDPYAAKKGGNELQHEQLREMLKARKGIKKKDLKVYDQEVDKHIDLMQKGEKRRFFGKRNT